MKQDIEIELERSLVFGWRRKIIEYDVKTKVVSKMSFVYTGFTEAEELEFLEDLEEGLGDYPM